MNIDNHKSINNVQMQGMDALHNVSGIDNFMLVVQAALDLAFEAGRWQGQVDLEEFYDREQYSSAIVEQIYSRKNAMPMLPASNGNTVTINLRSEIWREGVKKSSKEYLQKAFKIIADNYR